MRPTKSSFAIVLGIAMMTCGSAIADIYVDFGIHTGLPGTYSAAAPSPGVWNDITNLGSTGSLLATTGSVTSTSVNLTAGSATGNFTDPNNNDERLLNDNFFSSAGDGWSVNFSGLSDGTYDVYYYAGRNAVISTGEFTINGNAANPLDGKIGTLIQGTSWDVMTGVAVTGGTLDIASSSSIGFRGLAGVQLITTAAIPEPSSACLLGVVAVWGLAFRRRRK